MHGDPVDYPSDRTTPGLKPENIHLLSDLPGRLSTELFASAKLVRLAAGNTLFLAGDSGDDCYRIEDGLLKVTMVSHSENVTRILNDWQREKLVTRHGGYYCVENKAQLEHKVKL